jgi:hypothetical protein
MNPMQRLRQIHLYLGCVFAPLLAFFAASGIWQSFFLNYSWRQAENHPHVQEAMSLLTTLHTGRRLKMAGAAGVDTLSSPVFRYFVALMAVSLLVTMVLGVVMAFRFGRGRVVLACLAAGLVIPLGLVALVFV